MRRVCYSAAMSLDGYIAGPKGEVDWIIADPEVDFESLFGRFDTALVGRRSYQAARQMGSGVGMPGMTVHVISRTLKPADCPRALVSHDPAATVRSLKEAPGEGKDIWLFGGGELFRSLLALGLVDQIQVAVVPVLLGSGVPLLPRADGRAALRLTDHRVFPKTGTVLLDYDVVRRGE